MLHKIPYSVTTYFILAYVILRVAFLFPRWELGGANAVLSWDVFGYYLYLPAIYIYDDLDHLAFVPEIVDVYGNPSPAMGHALPLENGNQVLTYPMGLSIMYTPFFAIAHMLANTAGYPADGFSYPYQLAIGLGGIAYAWLGLWLLMRLLQRYYKDLTVAIVLAAIAVGTHYLNYTTADGAMPHNYLFTLYVGILWLTSMWHKQPRIGTAICLGALIGLATITRPTEIISILIPLLWGISEQADIPAKWRLLLQHKFHVLGLGLALFLVGCIQMLYWKQVTGQFLFYSYGSDKGFSFLSPHLIDALFSFRKGWLVYTPMMIFALLGFIPFYRSQQRYFFWAIAGFAIINLYIAFSWDIWWYGGGFGQRTMIQSYPLLAFPLAASVSWLLQRSARAAVGFIIMFLCMDLNLIQTWQIHAPGGGLRTDYMNRAYYWKVFGTTRSQKGDLKYLDASRELRSLGNRETRDLGYYDAESDDLPGTSTTRFHTGERSFKVDGATPEIVLDEIPLEKTGTAQDTWIRVRAYVFYESRPGDENQLAQIRTEFIRKNSGEAYHRVYVKLQRLAGSWNWYEVQFDRRMPRKPHPDDLFRISLSNPDPAHPVWLDDISLTWISPKP